MADGKPRRLAIVSVSWELLARMMTTGDHPGFRVYSGVPPDAVLECVTVDDERSEVRFRFSHELFAEVAPDHPIPRLEPLVSVLDPNPTLTDVFGG